MILEVLFRGPHPIEGAPSFLGGDLSLPNMVASIGIGIHIERSRQNEAVVETELHGQGLSERLGVWVSTNWSEDLIWIIELKLSDVGAAGLGLPDQFVRMMHAAVVIDANFGDHVYGISGADESLSQLTFAFHRTFRDIVWRSRSKSTPAMLAKIVKDSSTKENEKARYMRAFDFHSGPEKDAALQSILLD